MNICLTDVVKLFPFVPPINGGGGEGGEGGENGQFDVGTDVGTLRDDPARCGVRKTKLPETSKRRAR
jgi:hypothetical protein